MGPLSSKAVLLRFDISGDDNTIWIINGAQFNISSILTHTIQNVVKKFQNIVSANNPIIILNIMLILTIITCTITCTITFVYSRRRNQQSAPDINFNTYPHINPVQSPTYKEKPLSKNIPSSVRGYLV